MLWLSVVFAGYHIKTTYLWYNNIIWVKMAYQFCFLWFCLLYGILADIFAFMIGINKIRSRHAIINLKFTAVYTKQCTLRLIEHAKKTKKYNQVRKSFIAWCIIKMFSFYTYRILYLEHLVLDIESGGLQISHVLRRVYANHYCN